MRRQQQDRHLGRRNRAGDGQEVRHPRSGLGRDSVTSMIGVAAPKRIRAGRRRFFERVELSTGHRVPVDFANSGGTQVNDPNVEKARASKRCSACKLPEEALAALHQDRFENGLGFEPLAQKYALPDRPLSESGCRRHFNRHVPEPEDSSISEAGGAPGADPAACAPHLATTSTVTPFLRRERGPWGRWSKRSHASTGRQHPSSGRRWRSERSPSS